MAPILSGGQAEGCIVTTNSQNDGIEGEVCEDRGLKTEAKVKFSAERIAVPVCSICFEISST